MTNEWLLKEIEEAKVSGATELDLSEKGLTALPSQLFQLTNLMTLYLGGNQLTTLPPELFQLTSLIALDLSCNQLTTLPSELFQLTSLKGLTLSKNKLTNLPPEIGQLISLEFLSLSRNQLTTLPPEICQLTKLEMLWLNGNQLSSLPPEICQLTKLETLDLDYNPLISPPLEIANQGIEAIRKYFAELEKSKQPLNEVKIILVGDGAAGKTSLVKQLLGEAFDQHEDTTHGISIRNWQAQCCGKQIKVNLWDFGGQEVMHATHQFFLSKRSLYLLVLDGRKDERAEYWLRHIEAFGGNSPVLVVLNKVDANPSFDVNRPFLLGKYPGIRRFFHTSCRTGEGINELRDKLRHELAQVEMIGTLWPGTWFKVKRKLEQLQEPYISYEDYEHCCREAGIADEQSRELLVGFLHDLGVAVHFKDFALNTFSVLDPKWVTHGVYTIINAKQVAESKGVLHVDSLKEILKHPPPSLMERLKGAFGLHIPAKYCYCRETHRYLLDLMKKFQLCWGIGEQTVLIPQLLSVVEPDFTFDYKGSLRFALHYEDFLPSSVLPRFMVKVHTHIQDELRWRTGVVLKDEDKQTQAVVKADEEKQRISLWVQGEHKREYLHFLWYSLRQINSSFEKLKVSTRIPMPDDPARTADYDTLLNYAEQGISHYIPEGSDKKYSVHELLGQVQPDGAAELLHALKMVKEQLTDKESATEAFTSLFELKPNIAGIGVNLNEWFARIQAWDKQRRSEAR